MTQEFTPQRVANTRGPTYKFNGKLLGDYSTNPDGRKDRWQEVELWETPAGAWVAVLKGCSDRGREQDIVSATVIEPGGSDLERRIAVLDAMDWTPAARRLAQSLGWKFIVEID